MNTTAVAKAKTTMIVKHVGAVDYLVVGSGAMGLAFVDTLLTLQQQQQRTKNNNTNTPLPPSRPTVALIDSHSAPGGHWNDAYDFVQLHQPSLLYGVNSAQLEGHWGTLLCTQATLPWNHRATKAELLTYYEKVVDAWVLQGTLLYFPSTRYDFTTKQQPPQQPTQKGTAENATAPTKTTHEFVSLDGTTTYQIQVNIKLVDAVQGECKIPKHTPPEFAVDPIIQLWTPNDLYQKNQEDRTTNSSSRSRSSFFSWFRSSGWRSSTVVNDPNTAAASTQYVVIGSGKTGMNTIVYLLTVMRIPPKQIAWVIARDVWMLNRLPSQYQQALLRQGGDHEAAMDDLERRGSVYRLDAHQNIRPSAPIRFPVVDAAELQTLRKIDRTIRHGRVASIQSSTSSSKGKISSSCHPVLHFVNGTVLAMEDHNVQSTVFIHCSAPGPYNDQMKDPDPQQHHAIHDKTPLRLFAPGTMTLFPVFAPPIPLSGATLARIETARRNGTLDLPFARQLLMLCIQAKTTTTDDADDVDVIVDVDADTVLGSLMHPYVIGTQRSIGQLDPLWNLALLCALLDEDPNVAAQWLMQTLSTNRVSEYAWKMSKLQVVENVESMIQQARGLGYTPEETRALEMVAQKIAPLRGM